MFEWKSTFGVTKDKVDFCCKCFLKLCIETSPNLLGSITMTNLNILSLHFRPLSRVTKSRVEGRRSRARAESRINIHRIFERQSQGLQKYLKNFRLILKIKKIFQPSTSPSQNVRNMSLDLLLLTFAQNPNSNILKRNILYNEPWSV